MTLEIAVLKHRWTLTEYGPGEEQQRTFDLPYRDLIIGRSPEADVTIGATSVSKLHARLSFEKDRILVEDLCSTNGTHVNGSRVKFCAVVEGDLLQFANRLYRVGRRQAEEFEGTMEEGILPWAQTLLAFDRLVNEQAVVPYFQPIVTMDRKSTPGFELLARSNLDGLSNPGLMFGAAERLGQPAMLSELMRKEVMRVATASAPADAHFFLNTHPCEILNQRLKDSLIDLRAGCPSANITIEIHEGAVTEPGQMAEFQAFLKDLDMALSYDDFGAGQGRLLELVEVPPDVLKFDRQLIQNIDTASKTRQEMLAILVRLAIDLGTTPLAEGVETEAEHRTCLAMGFQLGQGYLYGRPKPFGTGLAHADLKQASGPRYKQPSVNLGPIINTDEDLAAGNLTQPFA